MNPTIAQAALLFMERVQLTGGEVPMFMQVVEALHAIASQLPLKDAVTEDLCAILNAS